MQRTKFFNLVLTLLVLASMLIGGFTKVSAQEPVPPTPPQDNGGTGEAQDYTAPYSTVLTNRITPAERQAAADRNTAKGLLPGLANPQVTKTNKRGPAPDPTVVPHYFGPFANYANSPMPMGSLISITVDYLGAGSGYVIGDNVAIYDVYGTGTGATAHVSAVDGAGAITGMIVDSVGTNYTAPMAIVESATGTGAAVTPNLDPATLTGGMRKFVDTLAGLGYPGNAGNNLGNYIPVAVADTTTFDNQPAPYASDYYEIALVEFKQQVHSDLPPTTFRGYVQLETPAVIAALIANGTPSQHVQLFYPDGSPILYSNGDFVYATDTPMYLGPTIVAAQGRPVRITFYNFLPTGAGGDLFIPVDPSVMGAGEGPLDAAGADCVRDIEVCETYSENRATLHLHGGLVPWISDGTPHQWTTPAGENTKYPTGVSTEYVPDMWFDLDGKVIADTVGVTTPPQAGATNNPSGPGSIAGEGAMTFYYNNQQSARLQFYHDHAYGITRLNVYAGEAAGYVVTDKVESDLINGTNVTGVNSVVPVKVLPDVGIPLIFQDKTFVDATTIDAQDPTWKWGTGELQPNGRRIPNTGDLWLPSVYMPVQNPWDIIGEANAFGRWQYGPWFWPPTEGVVNGPVANEYYDPGCDPAQTWCEPPMRPAIPLGQASMGMEAYMDTQLVNGVAYPTLTVDPKAYRFRILNAANDRFYNLSMFIAVDAAGNPCDGIGDVPEANGQLCTEVRMVPATGDPSVHPGYEYPATWPMDDRPGGAPDPRLVGPSWIQIATEGGFLPSPVVIPPQPFTWIMNVGLFNVGNAQDYSLLLGNAERADVIVDFSQYAGKTLIVYNDAPTAFPALDPRYDYYTGNPNQMDAGGTPTTQPGYGPNIRTVMQIKVSNVDTSADPFYNYEQNLLDDLNYVFSHDRVSGKPSVFEAAQPDIVVPQIAYNDAYGQDFPSDRASQYVNITDRSKTFTPVNTTTPVTLTFQEKAVHDEMGATWDNEYGRMSGNLGLELPGTNNLNQNIILYGFASPPVDFFGGDQTNPLWTAGQIGALPDGTTIWKITHGGVDVHPIHIHLANAQLINRVGWDGLLVMPDANELGWKETIRVNPLESTIWAVRPEHIDLPFDVPNSERPIDVTLPLGEYIMGHNGQVNAQGIPQVIDPQLAAVNIPNHIVNYGWEYVWHCHILSHEEMDMMHPLVFAIQPAAPSGLTVSGTSGTVSLSWTDNSVNETGWLIQRSANGGSTWTDINKLSTTGPAKGGTVSHSDTGLTPNALYLYRVMAVNVVGDSMDYTAFGGTVNSFPTVTKKSDTTATMANKFGVLSIVRANANPTAVSSGLDFTVTFSDIVTGVGAADFTPTGTAGGTVTGVTGSGTTYTVTVTGYASGTLGLSVPAAAVTSPDVTADFTASEVYDIDVQVPAVTSIVRQAGSQNPTNLTGVNFTVTFDRTVTGVDVTDFSVANASFTGESVKSVTMVAGTPVPGSVYTVTALVGTGTGTFGLSVVPSLNGVEGPTGNDLASGTPTGLNETFTVDTVVPTVSSVTLTSANPISGTTATFDVVFSEAVTGVDKTDFSLTTTGITGASVASVTGTGTTYSVTVNTGTGDTGTLRLNVWDNNSVLDQAGNPLTGNTTNHYTSGTIYNVAKPLMPISSNRLNGNPNNLANVFFRVTFSGTVANVDTGDFALTTTGVTGASISTVTPVSGSVYDVSVSAGTGSGTIRLDVVDDGTITNLGPTAAAGDGDFTGGQVYNIDKTLPSVVSVTRVNASPINAPTVYFTVTFSEPVTGVNAADFSLAYTGTLSVNPAIVSLTGSGATRTIGVSTGTGTTDGTIQLNVLNDSTVKDLVGNTLSASYNAGEVYTIDRTFPTVTSIALQNASPTNRTTVFYLVTFSEAVTGVDVADFALSATGVTGASIGSVTGTGNTRSVGVLTGTGNGTLGLNLVDNDSITDLSAAKLGGAGTGNGNFTGSVYTVDKTAPTVVSINRQNPATNNRTTVFYTVTFSESVTGVDLADFEAVTTGGITGATLSGISGSGTTRTVTINTGSGSGTIQLVLRDNNTIIDPATNPLGGAGVNDFTTGQVYTIDKTAPTVVSIVRQNPNPTTRTSVFYLVTFSESVTGVDAADFQVVTTNLTGVSVTGISGSGATRTVTVSTGTGTGGTLGLNIVDNDTIIDTVTNRLGGTGAGNGNFTGEVYNVR